MARSSRPDYDDLAGVDLSSLDLDAIELDLDRPSAWPRLLALLLLVGLGGAILWLPTTEWYQLRGGSGLFFALCGAGIVVGVALGRWLWRWAQDAGARYATARTKPRTHEPPSALRRWLTLLVVVGGATAIIIYVPASSYYAEGQAYQTTWFLAAGGALIIGILLGRWLLMQAAVTRRDEGPRPALKLPPWFKWVTLSVLLAMALFALLGTRLLGAGDGGTLEFLLGGVGFIVGVGGAIWLARRFDELEAKHKPMAHAGSRASRATVVSEPTSDN